VVAAARDGHDPAEAGRNVALAIPVFSPGQNRSLRRQGKAVPGTGGNGHRIGRSGDDADLTEGIVSGDGHRHHTQQRIGTDNRAVGIAHAHGIVPAMGHAGAREGKRACGRASNRRAVKEPLITKRRRPESSNPERHRRPADAALAGRLFRYKWQGGARRVANLVHPPLILPGTAAGIFAVEPFEVEAPGGQIEGFLFPTLLAGNPGDFFSAQFEAQGVRVGLRRHPPPELDCPGTGNGGAQAGGLVVSNEIAASRGDAIPREIGLAIPGQVGIGHPRLVAVIEGVGQGDGGNDHQRRAGAGHASVGVGDHHGVLGDVRGLDVDNGVGRLGCAGDGGAILAPLVVQR